MYKRGDIVQVDLGDETWAFGEVIERANKKHYFHICWLELLTDLRDHLFEVKTHQPFDVFEDTYVLSSTMQDTDCPLHTARLSLAAPDGSRFISDERYIHGFGVFESAPGMHGIEELLRMEQVLPLMPDNLRRVVFGNTTFGPWRRTLHLLDTLRGGDGFRKDEASDRLLKALPPFIDGPVVKGHCVWCQVKGRLSYYCSDDRACIGACCAARYDAIRALVLSAEELRMQMLSVGEKDLELYMHKLREAEWLCSASTGTDKSRDQQPPRKSAKKCRL